MSLLMDALRRAEEAKRKAGGNSRPAASLSPEELRLDPLETSPRGAQDSSVPPLAEHLDSVEADLASGAATAIPRGRPPTRAAPPDSSETRQAAERTAARNVFAVKQAPRPRTALWLFLGLVAVATIGIGGYFWWQLQSIAGGSPLQPATAARPAPDTPRQPPAGAAQPPSELAAAEASAPPLTATTEDPQRSAPAVERPASPSPAKRPPSEAASRPRAAAPGVFQRSNSRQQQAQTLNGAYAAWQAGRLDDARRGYEQVLRGDAKNADALLGLAAIAARLGQLEGAHALYLRVLESDPTDVTAQAALINLRGQNGAGQSESRLKTLIGNQPDSPALYFALGNLYAGQARWSEAQQAYFQAYALAPANADYLFNVAVSLDHLRQKKLAAQYYGMALSAAENAPGAFDKNAAETRILELQR